MGLLILVLLCFIAAANPVSCIVDFTLEAETSGAPVVRACIAKIKESAILPYDQNMLRSIAYVETRDGEDPATYSDPSNNGGIWQLSSEKYEATKVNVSSMVLEDIYKTFQINWTDTTWSDLRKPLYSALAARLYLEVIPEILPRALNFYNLQADYWANYYTSSGDESSKFREDVIQLQIQQGTCKADRLDVVFLLDSSVTIGEANFLSMKTLVHAIVNVGYDVGPDRVRIAVVTFSHEVVYHFHLNTYSTKPEVFSAIQDIPYVPGLTFTDVGLEAVLSHVFTEENGTRPFSEGVPRVLVVLTDGLSDHPNKTIEAAMALHQAGVVVFAIGIAEADITELNAIASQRAYVYYIPTFSPFEIQNLQIPVIEDTCYASLQLLLEEDVTADMHSGTFKNVNYFLPNDAEIAIKLNSTGSCVLYGSTIVTTPNAALHNIRINATGKTVGYFSDSRAFGITRDVPGIFFISIFCADSSSIDLELNIVLLESAVIDPPAESAFYASNVTTTCYINTTLPSTVVNWYKPDGGLVISNNQLLNGNSSTVNDNPFLIQETRNSIFGLFTDTIKITSKLTIVNLLESHEGIYTCNGTVSPIDGILLIEFDSFTVTANERVSNFNGVVTSPTMIELSWEVVPGVMAESLILACQELETDRSLYYIPADKTTLQILAQPNHTYSCGFLIGDINSVHKEGNVMLHTQPTGPGCVADLNGELINDTIVHLTWTAPINPNGEIFGYRVIYIGHRGTQDGYLHHGPFEELVDPMNDSIIEAIVIPDLWQGYIYEFKVQAINEFEVGGNNTGTVVLIPPEISEPNGVPGNLEVEFLNDSTIVLSWTPPINETSDIIDYRIEYTGHSPNNVSSGPFSITVNQSSDAIRRVISNLIPEYIYQFKVTGRNVAGYGRHSTLVVVMPSAVEPSKPGVPEDIKVEFLNDSSIVLTWSPPNDTIGAIEYQIKYTGRNKSQSSTTHGPFTHMDNSTFFMTQDLIPDYVYEFKIRARNDGGYSDYSTVIVLINHIYSYVTRDDDSSIDFDGVTEDLEVEFLNDSTIVLSWNLPSDGASDIIGYQIDYSGQDKSQINGSSGVLNTNINRSSDAVRMVIPNLIPEYIYHFKVQARNNGGVIGHTTIILQLPSAPVKAPVNLPAGAALNIGGEFISNDAVVISWDPPSDDEDIVYYQILYTGYESQQIVRRSTNRRIDGPYVIVVNSSNGTHRYQATVSDLQPDHYYEFKVRGRYNDGGYGDNNTALVLMPPTPRVVLAPVSREEDNDCIVFIILFIIFLILAIILCYILLLIVCCYCYCVKRRRKTYEPSLIEQIQLENKPNSETTTLAGGDDVLLLSGSSAAPTNGNDDSVNNNNEATSKVVIPMSGYPPDYDTCVSDPTTHPPNENSTDLNNNNGNDGCEPHTPDQLSDHKVPESDKVLPADDTINETASQDSDSDDEEDFETWKKNKPTYTAKTLTGSLGVPVTRMVTISTEDIRASIIINRSRSISPSRPISNVTRPRSDTPGTRGDTMTTLETSDPNRNSAPVDKDPSTVTRNDGAMKDLINELMDSQKAKQQTSNEEDGTSEQPEQNCSKAIHHPSDNNTSEEKLMSADLQKVKSTGTGSKPESPSVAQAVSKFRNFFFSDPTKYEELADHEEKKGSGDTAEPCSCNDTTKIDIDI